MFDKLFSSLGRLVGAAEPDCSPATADERRVWVRYPCKTRVHLHTADDEDSWWSWSLCSTSRAVVSGACARWAPGSSTALENHRAVTSLLVLLPNGVQFCCVCSNCLLGGGLSIDRVESTTLKIKGSNRGSCVSIALCDYVDDRFPRKKVYAKLFDGWFEVLVEPSAQIGMRLLIIGAV